MPYEAYILTDFCFLPVVDIWPNPASPPSFHRTLRLLHLLSLILLSIESTNFPAQLSVHFFIVIEVD